MTSPQATSQDPEGEFSLSAKQLESVLAAAALDAIRENQRFGLPMIWGVDGQIVYVDAFEAEASLLKEHPELANRKIP